MDVRMTLQPAVIFGLVSVQVIQDDVDLAAFVDGRDVVYEVEKLATPSAPIVKGGVNLDHFGGAKVDQLVKG